MWVRTPPRVLPALITPFTTDGSLDPAAFRANLKELSGRGVGGFLIGGSTGEGPYLEPGERQTLAGAARDALGPSAFLVAGVAGESVRTARAQVAEAAAGGADAALVLTPTSLIRGNHEAVEGFYRAVADTAPLPIMLYSVPRVTGYELPTERVLSLASHERILGMKDSGGRPVRIQELARNIDHPFFLFAGASTALAASMAAGGYGAITASANYVPELVAAIVESSDRSQAEADGHQVELTQLVRVVEKYGLPGTKAAAEAAGLRPGLSRPPLVALPEEAVRKIQAHVRQLAAVVAAG
jgi:dihydrodipicolinate synthase/N-acetylneuraminate lyase